MVITMLPSRVAKEQKVVRVKGQPSVNSESLIKVKSLEGSVNKFTMQLRYLLLEYC
jgi:hypothetical protein